MILAFTVPGPPVPCERPRVVNGHTYTPVRTVDYQSRVERYCLLAMGECGWPTLGIGPFRLVLRVYRQARRGDLDNFVKSCADAMNRARVWADDRYVDYIDAAMYVDKHNPRVEIEVHLLVANGQ